jgi:CheY-like chemotaxis protein
MAQKLKTVLVIDDEAIVRMTLARMLELAGYRVLQAVNGVEGLKVFAREHIDLVMCDIIMPEKEGIETIGEIRCKNRTVKIIAMSGGGRMGSGGFLDMAMRLGADHTLAKPFDREDLKSLLRVV